jgi:hypothetical protein
MTHEAKEHVTREKWSGECAKKCHGRKWILVMLNVEVTVRAKICDLMMSMSIGGERVEPLLNAFSHVNTSHE